MAVTDYSKLIETMLAEELQKEIDQEILELLHIEQLQKQGWYTVITSAAIEDIGGWMKNCRHDWRAFRDRYLFEDQDDAILFRLTWT